MTGKINMFLSFKIVSEGDKNNESLASLQPMNNATTAAQNARPAAPQISDDDLRRGYWGEVNPADLHGLT